MSSVYGNRLDFSVEERVRPPCPLRHSVAKVNDGYSVKSNHVGPSPTGPTPKLLQLQRPGLGTDLSSTSGRENGVNSPRRSFDSSSGSIRSDTSNIHILHHTWVPYLTVSNGPIFCGALRG